MKVLQSIFFVLSFLAIHSTEAHEHIHGQDHEDHNEDEYLHDHARSVEISSSVQGALGLRTVRPEKRRLAGITVLTGRYELAPEARRAIVTPVAGRLHLNVRTFDKVAKGDLLFTVAAPDLVSSADEIRLLEKRLDVYRELKTPNASLENDLAVKKAARAALLSGAEESNGIVSVRAGSDGVVEALPATDGTWLDVGSEVVRIIKPDALRLKALVSPAEIGLLTDGLPCRTETNEGELRIGLEAEGGLIPVYAVFASAVSKARVGSRGVFSCEADRSVEEVTCVPKAAIVRIGLKSAVFVRDVHDADRFFAANIVPGISAGGWTAVSGLPEDDDIEVVVEGSYELKLALTQDGVKQPAGHFHADGTFHEGED